MLTQLRKIFTVDTDPGRIYGLDILRALAILFVAMVHGGYLLPAPLREITFLFTFDGVSIFFVLSGYLIGGILIKILEKNEITPKLMLNFWMRRWFRTLPNYFLVLSVLCLLHFFFTDTFTLLSVNRYFFFSQNLFQPHPGWFFPEAWSLSIEEWFYLIVPILIAACIRILHLTPRKSMLFTAIGIIMAVTLTRYIRYSTVPVLTAEDWDLLFRKQVITRLDSIMYGTVGAFIHYYHPRFWLKYKNMFFLTGIALFMATKFIIPPHTKVSDLYTTVFSFSLISVSTLFLLPFLSNLKTGKGILYRFFTLTSLVSYSMYLLNLSVVILWINHHLPSFFPASPYFRYGFFWLLTYSMSILLYKNFEVPMTRLREKITFMK